MRLNWRAVAYGFITAIVLGILWGAIFPAADVTTPFLSYGLIGVIAGLVAGYYTKEGIREGAINGGVSTAIGSIIVFAVLALLGLLFAGLLASFGILGVGILTVVFYAIPGAIGGALGGWLEDRRMTRRAASTPR